MKYLVHSENRICEKLSGLLIKELQRFDIRGEIDKTTGKLDLKRLKAIDPDLFIIIGTNKSKSLINKAKKLQIRTAVFYQTLFKPETAVRMPTARVFFDLPIPNTIGQGSLLLDYLRTWESLHVGESPITPHIGIISSTRNRWPIRLNGQLAKANSSIKVEYVNAMEDLDKAIAKIQVFNAVVCTDQFSLMLAALTNCPAVYVFKKELLAIRKVKKIRINELLGKELINAFSSKNLKGIDTELSMILSDHNYSADILNDYQLLKSMVGTQPFARQVAQELIDWLESH